MPVYKMKYGNTSIDVSIDNASSITVLEPVEAEGISDLKATFRSEVETNTIDSPALSNLVAKDDLVTIVLSDVTRLWSKQDKVCKELVEFLNEECEVPFENIAILLSLGTHRPQTEEEDRRNVTDWVYERVKVVPHDYRGELKYLGTTSYGTPMYVNPLVVDRKVIIIGSTVHHVLAGYGGGRKSILPGVAGEETILKNHLLAMHPTEERSTELVGMGLLETNPIQVDMNEAVAMVNPVFGINIVMNKDGNQAKLVCGNWKTAWEKSCEITNEINGRLISEKADIVIGSCGGYPKDMNLYQGSKTIFNMAEAVKDGGTMIFFAECIEGGGAPDFFDWAKSLKTKTLDADLRANFTISGYVFYALCERLNKAQALVMSTLPKETLADLNIKGYQSADELFKDVDFTGKSVIVMPYGGATVPIYKSQACQ